ncbi:MAG: outer membrane protein assembly factor BamD, partial [Bacteroidetes bacterium]|nr:outer membrane protein assembly factor BamD [Bacteroidota bacterium]
DINLKYKAYQKYYEMKDYTKALGLLEELVLVYRGNQDIYYQFANCHYQLGNYILASYHFKNFAESYPLSEKAEEAYYLYAYSLYLESPLTDLDQSSSQKAIDAFQLFLNKYPDTKRAEECNKHIDELSQKIEEKEYATAMLYYQIEDYKAAVWSLHSYLNSYPSTPKRELIEYTIVKSGVELASNSIESKKAERLNKLIEYCNDFNEKFATSVYSTDVKKHLTKATTELNKIKNEKL